MVAALAMVAFFTLQDASGTMAVSEAVRGWLADCGIVMTSAELRSNVHILEYFVLALAMLAFGLSRGWKISTCVIACCLVGLADELLKIALPTRHFDAIDLMKDWLGASLAGLCVLFARGCCRAKRARQSVKMRRE